MMFIVRFCRHKRKDAFVGRGWVGAQVLSKVSVGVSSKTFRLGTMVEVVLLVAVGVGLTQAELVCCAMPVLNTAVLATRVEQGRKRGEGVSLFSS